MKEIIKTQTYTIKTFHCKDGSYTMERTNDGFDSLELLGALSLTINEITFQLTKGIYTPDVVKRIIKKDAEAH